MQISYSFHISSKKNSITTTQKLSSVSKHNMRKYSSKDNQTGHYDSEKIVQLVGTDNLFRDVENVYHEQFDQALTDYNINQKRTDRKIPDYMRYISENAKSDLAVEAIIQLGDKEFWEQVPEQRKRQMVYIYKDQLNAIRQHIPEFAIANAVIHFDESSPHMHVIGVPVSSGYKRGLSKQCAKTRVFTKDSLEKLQNVLRERALKGMEKNQEIFQDISLKPKEAGRNSDYSKEYYIRRKKEEMEIIEEELAASRYALSEIEDETQSAKEQLNNLETELTRKEQETFALVPFHENDVFPVQGKTMKISKIDLYHRKVSMRSNDPHDYFSMEKTYPLALVQKSFFEYMYSDIGLAKMRENMEEIQELQKKHEKKRESLEAEKQELLTLKKDVEKLSRMECPFHAGDRFEVDGEMVTVNYVLESIGEVSVRTQSGRDKDIPLLHAIRSYRSFMKKEELTEECRCLKHEIEQLADEARRWKQVFSEMDTVWYVFRHFPVVKDFILELGRRIKCFIGEMSLEDIKELFTETVMGIKKPEKEHHKSRTR